MSSYYFATFHQKKTIPPTCRKDISVPRDLRDCTSQARARMVSLFEMIYHTPQLLADDGKLLELHQACDNYLKWLVKLVADGHRFDLYCYWSESLCPKTNHAFNDLYYDAANVMWNLACVELNHANHILTFGVNANNLDAVEKQAYAALCLAAGRYKLAREMVAQVSVTGTDGSNNNTLLSDCTPDFFDMMEKLALAQAQEIGASKAARKDDGTERKVKDNLVAKLTHQVYNLYYEASCIGSRKVTCPTEKFSKFLLFLDIKCAVYEGLTCAYAASATYDDSAENGLWLVQKSTELFAPCRGLIERGKFDHFISNFIDSAERTQYRIQDRIESMNRLVVRAKPATSKVTYPPAQVLARAKEVTLPEAAVMATDGLAATKIDWEVVDGENGNYKNGSEKGAAANGGSGSPDAPHLPGASPRNGPSTPVPEPQNGPTSTF